MTIGQCFIFPKDLGRTCPKSHRGPMPPRRQFLDANGDARSEKKKNMEVARDHMKISPKIGTFAPYEGPLFYV
jgi:hypothetical protein